MSQEKTHSQLVVIGSSAGGVEALSNLLPTLPADFPAPIVIAQHIDPHRQSHLGAILSRHSALPVRTVADRESLDQGVVFVVPANRHVEITDHDVRLRADSEGGPKPSVDLLFSSAAQAYGEGLTAVVLTGTGSDGAAGARHVKEAGGTVIIQNPETATYPAMPLSLSPSMVDIVADLDRIGPLLTELATGRYIPTPPDQDRALRLFLSQLREHSGIDFNSYKQPTILRRLQRRMLATGMEQLGDYVRYTQSHPEEYQRLVNSFLIKVTEFFRDRPLFNHLKQHMLPRLIEEARERDRELRLWSAGCATGEEAYSLAILVSDLLGDELADFKVRIFGTDLDADAVAFARRGIYPAAAFGNLPQNVIARHFEHSDGEYRVSAGVRSLIIFGQHDLGQRAPFPRIDVVMCRNVLIYFTSELQKRALELFAFSLRDGGHLVLGQAETAGALDNCFASEHPRLKIYVRQGERILIPPSRSRDQPLASPVRLTGGTGRALEVRAEHDNARQAVAASGERLLLGLPVGIVVVDRRYDIQMLNTTARRLLGIHAPAIGEDLIHLAQGVPDAELKKSIDAAFEAEPRDPLDMVVSVETPSGEQRQVEIACYPHRLAGGAASRPAAVIVVTDVTRAFEERSTLRGALADARAQRETLDERLHRLETTNRQLLSANEELTLANTELRGTNEEFLVSNEEMQAATEEVETLNEELQAANEELETLNEELQAAVEELNTTNDDLQARSVELEALAASLEDQRRASEAERAKLSAIVESIGDGVLVVDHDGKRALSNDAYDAVFDSQHPPALQTADGQPLPVDAWPQARAARRESFSMEFTIEATDGMRHWYEASGQPIHTRGAEEGGVVVVRDITERSLRALQEEFLAVASHDLRTPLTATQVYLEMVIQLLSRNDASERTQRYADLALRQVHRLGELVRDLVDVARLQHGRLALSLTEVDLASVVREVVEVAQALAKGQAIQVSESDAELRVQADRGRLHQVILNLLMNAIMYAPGTERIDVRLGATDGQAEVKIRDYGPGIPAAELSKIFSRFFRANAAAAADDTGLGLGLYIARELTAAHGGTLDARSTEGKGTTFTVRLPLSES